MCSFYKVYAYLARCKPFDKINMHNRQLAAVLYLFYKPRDIADIPEQQKKQHCCHT